MNGCNMDKQKGKCILNREADFLEIQSPECGKESQEEHMIVFSLYPEFLLPLSEFLNLPMTLWEWVHGRIEMDCWENILVIKNSRHYM